MRDAGAGDADRSSIGRRQPAAPPEVRQLHVVPATPQSRQLTVLSHGGDAMPIVNIDLAVAQPPARQAVRDRSPPRIARANRLRRGRRRRHRTQPLPAMRLAGRAPARPGRSKGLHHLQLRIGNAIQTRRQPASDAARPPGRSPRPVRRRRPRPRPPRHARHRKRACRNTPRSRPASR